MTAASDASGGAVAALIDRGEEAGCLALSEIDELAQALEFEDNDLGALYELPVVYVCENNSEGALGSAGGGFPTSVSAVDDLTDIPKTFGIPVETVDGRDPDAVAAVVAKGIEHTRARKGPFFVHVVTARYAGTQPLWPTLPTGPTDISMAWDDSGISGEHEQWYREHDPVLGYARKLLGSGDVTQDELTEMDARVSERIAEARQFALDSPRPTPESALDNVFA